MSRKIIALLTSLVLLVSLLAACSFDKKEEDTKTPASTSEKEPAKTASDTKKEPEKKEEPVAEPKIIRIVSGGEPGSLHPGLAQGTHESIILDHVFEGLMKRDDKGNVVKGMAADIKTSEDKLSYTITLRDAKWSDGQQVVAKDFEYAWKYALNPLTASEYAYQLYYLVGGEEYNSYSLTVEGDDSKNKADDVVAKDLTELEAKVGVKAINEKTLEINLRQPTPYFLELLAFYTYYPVPHKVQEENPDWAIDGNTFLCNGPFTVTEWNHDESVILKKNTEYYDADKVKIDGIDFAILENQNTDWQMYQAGDVDINYNLPPDVLGKLRADKNPELITQASLSTYFYRFNTTTKPFSNVKVRKALSMAIDRKTIVEEVSQGGQIPAFGLVPGGIPDTTGDFRENGGKYFSENLDEAKKLLAEGLAEEGMDELSFVLLYNTNEGHKKIAVAIQEMWSKLGVTIELENTEFRVKIDRESSLDYEVARAGWIGDYVDPNTFLDMFTSWSGQNNTGWENAEYDKLIKAAGNEFDPAKRMEYLHEAEELLMDELPIMPIYYYTESRVTKPYVKGTYKAVNREVCMIYADLEK